MRVVDLFAGAGGMSLGAAASGFEVVAAFDNWTPAVRTYEANFDHPIFNEDLSDVAGLTTRLRDLEVDVVTGGPPCQDFSHAGIRSEGNRAELTVSFAESICAVLPRAFIMENVPSALRSKAYGKARLLFESAGYGLTELVVNASYFGVPQKRSRLFVVGILGGADEALLPTIEAQQSLFALSVRRGVPSIAVDHYYRHPRSYDRRAIFSVDEPSPTIRGTNRPRPKGYKVHPGDASNLPDIRALTSSERALIQTFPTHYVWDGTKSEVDQMIGNAVPPKLAGVIFAAVSRHLSNITAQEAAPRWPIKADSIDPIRSSRLIKALRKMEQAVPLELNESVSTYLDRLASSAEFSGLREDRKEKFREVMKEHSTFVDDSVNRMTSQVH